MAPNGEDSGAIAAYPRRTADAVALLARILHLAEAQQQQQQQRGVCSLQVNAVLEAAKEILHSECVDSMLAGEVCDAIDVIGMLSEPDWWRELARLGGHTKCSITHTIGSLCSAEDGGWARARDDAETLCISSDADSGYGSPAFPPLFDASSTTRLQDVASPSLSSLIQALNEVDVAKSGIAAGAATAAVSLDDKALAAKPCHSSQCAVDLRRDGTHAVSPNTHSLLSPALDAINDLAPVTHSAHDPHAGSGAAVRKHEPGLLEDAIDVLNALQPGDNCHPVHQRLLPEPSGGAASEQLQRHAEEQAELELLTELGYMPAGNQQQQQLQQAPVQQLQQQERQQWQPRQLQILDSHLDLSHSSDEQQAQLCSSSCLVDATVALQQHTSGQCYSAYTSASQPPQQQAQLHRPEPDGALAITESTAELRYTLVSTAISPSPQPPLPATVPALAAGESTGALKQSSSATDIAARTGRLEAALVLHWRRHVRQHLIAWRCSVLTESARRTFKLLLLVRVALEAGGRSGRCLALLLRLLEGLQAAAALICCAVIPFDASPSLAAAGAAPAAALILWHRWRRWAHAHAAARQHRRLRIAATGIAALLRSVRVSSAHAHADAHWRARQLSRSHAALVECAAGRVLRRVRRATERAAEHYARQRRCRSVRQWTGLTAARAALVRRFLDGVAAAEARRASLRRRRVLLLWGARSAAAACGRTNAQCAAAHRRRAALRVWAPRVAAAQAARQQQSVTCVNAHMQQRSYLARRSVVQWLRRARGGQEWHAVARAAAAGAERWRAVMLVMRGVVGLRLAARRRAEQERAVALRLQTAALSASVDRWRAWHVWQQHAVRGLEAAQHRLTTTERCHALHKLQAHASTRRRLRSLLQHPTVLQSAAARVRRRAVRALCRWSAATSSRRAAATAYRWYLNRAACMVVRRWRITAGAAACAKRARRVQLWRCGLRAWSMRAVLRRGKALRERGAAEHGSRHLCKQGLQVWQCRTASRHSARQETIAWIAAATLRHRYHALLLSVLRWHASVVLQKHLQARLTQTSCHHSVLSLHGALRVWQRWQRLNTAKRAAAAQCNVLSKRAVATMLRAWRDVCAARKLLGHRSLCRRALLRWRLIAAAANVACSELATSAIARGQHASLRRALRMWSAAVVTCRARAAAADAQHSAWPAAALTGCVRLWAACAGARRQRAAARASAEQQLCDRARSGEVLAAARAVCALLSASARACTYTALRVLRRYAVQRQRKRAAMDRAVAQLKARASGDPAVLSSVRRACALLSLRAPGLLYTALCVLRRYAARRRLKRAATEQAVAQLHLALHSRGAAAVASVRRICGALLHAESGYAAWCAWRRHVALRRQKRCATQRASTHLHNRVQMAAMRALPWAVSHWYARTVQQQRRHLAQHAFMTRRHMAHVRRWQAAVRRRARGRAAPLMSTDLRKRRGLRALAAGAALQAERTRTAEHHHRRCMLTQRVPGGAVVVWRRTAAAAQRREGMRRAAAAAHVAVLGNRALRQWRRRVAARHGSSAHQLTPQQARGLRLRALRRGLLRWNAALRGARWAAACTQAARAHRRTELLRIGTSAFHTRVQRIRQIRASLEQALATADTLRRRTVLAAAAERWGAWQRERRQRFQVAKRPSTAQVQAQRSARTRRRYQARLALETWRGRVRGAGAVRMAAAQRAAALLRGALGAWRRRSAARRVVIDSMIAACRARVVMARARSVRIWWARMFMVAVTRSCDDAAAHHGWQRAAGRCVERWRGAAARTRLRLRADMRQALQTWHNASLIAQHHSARRRAVAAALRRRQLARSMHEWHDLTQLHAGQRRLAWCVWQTRIRIIAQLHRRAALAQLAARRHCAAAQLQQWRRAVRMRTLRRQQLVAAAAAHARQRRALALLTWREMLLPRKRVRELAAAHRRRRCFGDSDVRRDSLQQVVRTWHSRSQSRMLHRAQATRCRARALVFAHSRLTKLGKFHLCWWRKGAKSAALRRRARIAQGVRALQHVLHQRSAARVGSALGAWRAAASALTAKRSAHLHAAAALRRRTLAAWRRAARRRHAARAAAAAVTAAAQQATLRAVLYTWRRAQLASVCARQQLLRRGTAQWMRALARRRRLRQRRAFASGAAARALLGRVMRAWAQHVAMAALLRREGRARHVVALRVSSAQRRLVRQALHWAICQWRLWPPLLLARAASHWQAKQSRWALRRWRAHTRNATHVASFRWSSSVLHKSSSSVFDSWEANKLMLSARKARRLPLPPESPLFS